MIAPPETPSLGQKTDNPTRLFGGFAYSGGFGGSAFGAPGVGGLGLGVAGIWPGWGSMLWGTYAVYRTMLRHATIAYAVSQVLGPLLGSEWTVDADQDAPPDAVAWVQDNIIAHRPVIMPHALRSVVFGNSPFEVVWDLAQGRYVVSAYVPLLPDYTQVLRERNGAGPFAGLRNGNATLSPAECLYVLNGSDVLGNEPGDDYGRSRLENIRDTAWVGWLDTARRLAELEDRASGIVPIIIVPHGTPAGQTGTPKTFAQLAADLLPSLCHPRSQGAVIETPGISEVDAGTQPERLKQLSTTVDSLDMGQRGESQAQMRAKLEYWDNMIGRGMYRGERTLFNTQGGTKADAGQHTENSEPDLEAIDNSIARQVNEGPAKTGLTLNYGADIRKKVRGIKPAPQIDREKIAAAALINILLQNTQTGPDVLPFIDGDKLFDQAGVPFIGKWQELMQKREQAAAEANKARQQQQQNGGGVPPAKPVQEPQKA